MLLTMCTHVTPAEHELPSSRIPKFADTDTDTDPCSTLPHMRSQVYDCDTKDAHCWLNTNCLTGLVLVQLIS